MTSHAHPGTVARSPLERGLALFSDVRPGEGTRGLALLGSVFLLLAANYFVKPARDGLLAITDVRGLSSMELKAYSSFGQGVLLILLLPLYERLAARLSRRALVTHATLVFIASLGLFWLLQPGILVAERLPMMGVAFYLWVGVFNVFVVAQFWTFAADVYGDDSGRRLFPVIAIGGAAGATAGAWAAKHLAGATGFGTYALVLLAAVLLAGALALMRAVDTTDDDAHRRRRPPASPDGASAWHLLRRHRYLAATAAVVVLATWVKTNTDNLLFAVVQEALRDEVAARGLVGADAVDAFVSDQTTAFYGDLFFWINLSGLVLQALFASRALKYGGFAPTLLALPLLASLGYGALALMPALGLFRLMKIAEVSLGYSLHNTALQVLWLRSSREAKYKAKTAIDTMGVRFGDGLAALTAFVGIHILTLAVPVFFTLNAVLVLVWLGLAVVLAREYRRLRRTPPS